MVWRAEDPQGNEARKVRYDIVPYAGASGLDLGCGPDKIFEQFVGIDNGADTQLFGIPMRPNFMVKTCERLHQFSDCSWPCVFSSHLLEHIVDYKGALREWWRLVEVGGYLVLYLPHADLYPNIGQPGANPDHKHDFRNEDILEAMVEVADDWEIVVDEKRDQLQEYSFLQVYRKRPAGSGRTIAVPPKPAKTACVVRPGAYGDALWGSSIAAALKAEGYHVTMITSQPGGEVLAADPNIDRLLAIRGDWFDDEEWILYYLWEAKKYDRFINLIGVVEQQLLPHPTDPAYYWPGPVRHAKMNRNYLEEMHAVAQLPAVFNQRFYPRENERAWAAEQRAKHFPGPFVVVSPTGSSGPKAWPHVQAFIDLMAAIGVYTCVVGDIRQEINPPEKFSMVLGKELPIRLIMTLAQTADVVVGTESAIVNSVAMEDCLKVVLLSHSTPENLTKHWRNTMAVEPTGLPCYPCHRLHKTFNFCTRDETNGASMCQSKASAEAIADAIAPYIARAFEREQKAA